MTCKQCENYDECDHNPRMKHTMWMIDFWENAEKRCKRFEPVIAHWYINPDGYYPQCSNCCEEPTSGELEEVCPNCGAEMESNTK